MLGLGATPGEVVFTSALTLTGPATEGTGGGGRANESGSGEDNGASSSNAGRVAAVYITRNPDKLRHLEALVTPGVPGALPGA